MRGWESRCTRVSFGWNQKLQKQHTKFLYTPHPAAPLLHLPHCDSSSQLRKQLAHYVNFTLYSDVTSFYLLSSVSCPGTRVYCAGSSGLWQLFLMTTVLRSTGQIFCKKSLDLGLFDFLFLIGLRIMGFGRKTTQVTCHSHHITRVHATWLITVDIRLDHITGWCWPAFSTVELFSSLSLCMLCKSKSLHAAHTPGMRGGKVSFTFWRRHWQVTT